MPPRTDEDYDQLRQRLDAMEGMLADAADTNTQLQAELDDLRISRSGPGSRAATDAEDDDERDVVVTNMPPPPPRTPPAPALTAPMQQFSQKEDMRAWANTANSWRWFITGVKPMTTGLTLQRTKLLLHGKAEITARAHGMLADMAEIDVQEFIPYGDDPRATDRMPTEHLDIFIVATITLLSKGVVSSASRARVAVLEQGLRSGLEMLRRHCIECRTQVRIRANFNMLVRQINTDLNTWAARLFDEATAFVGVHEAPPAIEVFPEVAQPAWTRLSNFIACRWLHAHDPNRKSGNRKGGGGEKNGGGSGRSNDDTDREDGGGDGGGRGNSRNNGSSGGGSSSRGDGVGGRSGGDGVGRGNNSGGGGGSSRR